MCISAFCRSPAHTPLGPKGPTRAYVRAREGLALWAAPLLPWRLGVRLQSVQYAGLADLVGVKPVTPQADYDAVRLAATPPEAIARRKAREARFAATILVPMTSNVVTVVVKPGQSAVDALVKIGAASAKAASKWDRAMRRKVDVK